MAHRSQCSSAGDNPLDPNYLPPHYREEYRMAIDALVDGDLEGYYGFLQGANVVDFLSQTEIEYIKCRVRAPHRTSQSEKRYMAEDGDGSSDTYWPVHSDLDAPSLDLGWPQQLRFVGPTEVTTLVNPPDPEMPSIKEQVRRMIKNAQQVIAVVMDMFTDVDIFADILNAAMRGVAVYILLDELNAHHFVLMANNCRVNLDEMKFMRVRTVPGTTYFCHTGKSFKGQMMDRFILVDCRAVLTGNYSFMWSFEKIHRCLAHLFLGQLVTTFDEEFRILFAHSEPLVVEKVLANMSQYSNIHEGHLNMEKTHMFNREFPKMLPERAGHFAEDYMTAGDKMLPFRNIEPPTQPFREGHPFMEHGRQMRGPIEMSGFKRHGYPDVPDYGYMPPQNQPTMRGKQFIEGVVPKGGHFAREPGFYQGAGLQPDYDMYGRFRGHQIDQFPGAGYPHEVNEAEPPGAYDHVQRYLQSQPPMEEGHGARNVLTPAQSNTRRHSMGQSYTCQTSPTQPNLPDQKRLSNVNRKPQDVSQKQGLRDWRISSYLSAFDDGGDMDFPDVEGSDSSDNAPCFVPEGPGGPMGAEIRPGNIEFNRMMPPSMNNSTFFQIRNSPSSPLSLVDHPPDLPENIKIPIAIKTPPTSESSCTTEGDKVEETQIKKPKEINLFGEEFLRSKPTRAVPRSSRLRHSLIFSSNLELNTSGDSKDALGENDGDEASKLTARVSQIMDKRRSSAREPFQWSNFVQSATIDDQAIESARSETSLNKIGVDSDVSKVDNSQDPVQGKNLPETVQSTALEEKSKRDEAKVWQMSSFVDMNDPDSRLRYFKELAAQRKAELAAAKASQSNPEKAPKKPEAPEKPLTSNVGKKAPLTTPTIQDTKCEESSEDILHRATDTEKIRMKQKLAEESLNSFQKDTTLTLNPAVETRKESQKCGKTSQPVTNSPSKPFSRNVEALSAPSNAVDSSSIQYSATVDSLVGSKLINTDPSLAVSRGEDLSQKPITVRAESSQQPTAKGEQTQKHSSQQSTATENEPAQKPFKQPTPMKTDSSQHPSAAESSSSQTLATTKTDPSQNPTVMKAESSQQFSATEGATAQKQAAMNEEPFKQPTAVKNKSFQQPTAKDANSFQQPTATENKHAQKLPAMEADSSHQLSTSAETDSSLQPNALEVRSSMFLTATENEHAHKPDATEEKSFQHLPENKHAQKMADSLPHPFATENETSQKTSATETESVHHSGSTENKPAQKSAMETESVHHSGSTENKPAQKSAMETESVHHSGSTENKPAQKSAMETESVQHPGSTENKPAQKSAMETESVQHSGSTENKPAQKSAMETESVQHPGSTENKPAQKSAMETESVQHSGSTENKPAQKSAMETESVHHSGSTENKPAQKSAMETESVQHPGSTENKPAQKSAMETESVHHSGSTENKPAQKSAMETESVQHPGSTENKPAQKSAMETESVQHPGSTENKPAQKSIAMETGSLQYSPATEDEHAQKPETESVQHPCATDSEHVQESIAMETGSLQHSHATEDEHAQKPDPAETESVQHPCATENEHAQKTTAIKVDSCQQPTELAENFSTATEKHSQNPTATEAESFLQPTLTETDSSQNLTAAVRESLQQPTATENELAQKPTSTDAETSQQPVGLDENSKIPTAEIEHVQKTATEGESLQQSPATENEPAQKAAATGEEPSQHHTTTDPSQQPTLEVQSSTNPTATENVQNPDAAQAELLQHLPAKESNSSQQPTEVESELIQESTSERVDCFQQSAVIGTDDSQKSSSTEADVSQQSTSEERQSSERPKGADSFQKPSALEEDPSQHPTTTKNEPSQHPTETLDDSQNPTETVTDSSHKPNSKRPISIECESIHHPTDTKCVSASHSTLKVTLSPQTISFSDTFPGDSHILFQTGSVGTSAIETNNQNILITTVCTIQSEHEDSESRVVLPTITSSETQETSSATSEQKGDNVCQDVSKQGTILTTNITPGLSQSIITDSSSSAEVHETEKPCPQTDDGKIELNSSLEQAQVKASITSAVNDADNVVVSLNSVAKSSNELHDSTEPDTTQQSVTSSVHESSSLNDPKPQDENQKHEEQPQRHDSSAIPQGSEIAKVSTSATNQTTPENCVSNLSEKSESVVMPNSAENAKSQSAVTENPKPIPSAHQSSTANVISCSNLRDDTKVLLEQISAKNQRTKQAANEEKEGGVKSGGQELSSFLGRSWTSKASAEEKEMLLQKMEKMRKESKVYSRFEAS